MTTNYEPRWGYHYLLGVTMAANRPTQYYGNFSGICQLCYVDKERFGTLVDPNGHSWLICADCITILWDAKQAMKVNAEAEARAADAVLDRLRDLLAGE